VLEGLSGSPALYPLALDPARDAFLLARLDAAGYRAASFLDERLGLSGTWLAAGEIEQALSAARDIRPLHFIFHAGHVGSTLLSRLLDETGRVLGLREPLPLRLLAEAKDAGAPWADARLELCLKLWERGFADTDAVVVKATSAAERLAPLLLSLRPRARAVMLNVSAQSYLATMLAGENSAADLNAHGPERMHRLGRLLGAPPPRPTDLGTLAAMSWLAERLTQAEIARAFGERILTIDFDTMLETLPQTLTRVLAHFEIACAPERIREIAEGPVAARYSKAPEHAYSPSLRREQLAQARANFPKEIRAALVWIADLKARHPSLAAIE